MAGWVRAAAVLGALLVSVSATGCKSMTAEQFVNDTLQTDEGFRATARAVDYAQQAYHAIADTPIREIPAQRERIVELLQLARDSFRRSQTFSINLGSPVLKPRVKITDINADRPDPVRVKASGTAAMLVVAFGGGESLLLTRFETTRGKEVVSFGANMSPVVATEFKPFLLGDSIRVEFESVVLSVRHDATDVREVGNPLAAPASTAPAPAGGPGAPAGSYCDGCGNRLAAGARFCNNCGKAVTFRDLDGLPGFDD